MRVYVDSSAFIKRYIDEDGSDEVLGLFRSDARVVLSSLSLTEVASFLNRMVREKVLGVPDYALFKKIFLRDYLTSEIQTISEEVLTGTIGILEKHALRSLDAIHLATARASSCDRFVTADRRQHETAVALGIKSELI